MKKFGAGAGPRPLRSKKAWISFSNARGPNKNFRPLRKPENTGHMFVNLHNARPSIAPPAPQYFSTLMAQKRRNECVSNHAIPCLLKKGSYSPKILKSHPNKKHPKLQSFNSSQNPTKAPKNLDSPFPKSGHKRVNTPNSDHPTGSQKVKAEQKISAASGINICDEKDKSVTISQMNELKKSQQSAYAEHLKKLKRKSSSIHEKCFGKSGEEASSRSNSPKKMKLQFVATPKSSPGGLKIGENERKPKLPMNVEPCPKQGVETITAPQNNQPKKQVKLQSTNKSSTGNANKSSPQNQTMSKAKVGAAQRTIIKGQPLVNSTTANREKSINNKKISPNPIQNTNTLCDRNNPSSVQSQMARSETRKKKCENDQSKQHNSAYLEHLKKLKKTSKPISPRSSQKITKEKKLEVSNGQKATISSDKTTKEEKETSKTAHKLIAVNQREKTINPEEKTLKTMNNRTTDPRGKKTSQLGPKMTGDQVDHIRNSTKIVTDVEKKISEKNIVLDSNKKKTVLEKKALKASNQYAGNSTLKMIVKANARAVRDSYEEKAGMVKEKEALTNSVPADDDSPVNNLQTSTLAPLMSIKIKCPASSKAHSRPIPLVLTVDSNIQKQSKFIATESIEEGKRMVKANIQTEMNSYKEKSSVTGKADGMAKIPPAHDTSSVNSLKMSAVPSLMSIRVDCPNLVKAHARPIAPILMVNSNIQKQGFNATESSEEGKTMVKAHAQAGEDAYQKKEAIGKKQLTGDSFPANNLETSAIAPLMSIKIECSTSSDARPIPSILTVDSNTRKQGVPVTKNYVRNANSNLLTCISNDEGTNEAPSNTQLATPSGPVGWEFFQGAISHACFPEASECASAEDINLSIKGASDGNLQVKFNNIPPVTKQSGDCSDQSSSGIGRNVVKPEKSLISTNFSTRTGHSTSTLPITTYEKIRQLATLPLSVENKQPSTEEVMKFNEDEFFTIDSTFADDEVKTESTAQPHGKRKAVASDFFSDIWTDGTKSSRSVNETMESHGVNHMEQHQLLADKGNISTRCSNPKTRPDLRKESDVISVMPSVELEGENVHANMSIDSAIAAGFQFLQPVSGYHCILCQTFYHDYPTALHHCTQLSHKMKVIKQLETKNRATSKS